MRIHTRTALAAAAALALALGTAACTEDTGSAADSDTTTSATQAGESTESEAAVVVFQNGWAKATDTEMSGVFGAIRNTGDADVHLIGVASNLGGRAELHETVPGGSGTMMQEKQDGFVIPPGGELVLEPGGNHIMLMDLDTPITTGQTIGLALEFDDGTDQDVTVTARDFKGGEEEYVGGSHAGTSNDG